MSSRPAKVRIVGDQAAGEQRVDGTAAVGTLDVADVGARDVLLVGDDREHLDRRTPLAERDFLIDDRPLLDRRMLRVERSTDRLAGFAHGCSRQPIDGVPLNGDLSCVTGTSTIRCWLVMCVPIRTSSTSDRRAETLDRAERALRRAEVAASL